MDTVINLDSIFSELTNQMAMLYRMMQRIACIDRKKAYILKISPRIRRVIGMVVCVTYL